jgi:hypothetical protein
MTLNYFVKYKLRSITGLVGVALLALGGCAGGPPVQEMSDARQAIAVAREAGASQYAPTELRDAENYLDSALRSLTRKEYSEARDDAIEAKNSALAALENTERVRDSNPPR